MRPRSPSLTAEAVCFIRAADALRPSEQRVVDDPYARHFLRRSARALLAALATNRRADTAFDAAFAWLATGLVTYVRCRHRFIDDALRRALEAHEVDQVVVLGAGYDARAWRFAELLAGVPVFEVDYPTTGARKAKILAAKLPDRPAVDVRAVAVDFEAQRLDERLLAAGFEPGRRTFFLWEGVSLYLTRAAVKATLATLAQLGGPGSRLALDLFQQADRPDLRGTMYRMSGSALHLLGEPVTFVLHAEDAPDFLARAGWGVRDLANARELRRRYVRDGRGVYPMAYAVDARWTDVSEGAAP